MTPREQEQILEWDRAFEGEISPGLVTTDDPRSGDLEQFCEELENLTSGVCVARKEGGAEDLPAITLGHSFIYHGVPLGHELAPFLEALSGGDLTGRSFSRAEKDRLHRSDLPALLRLFVTPQCRFCPSMVRQLLPITAENESIRLAIVDGTLFPEEAQSERIQSVPTLLLDRQYRWTGSVPLHELLEVLANRDPVRLGPSSLENMLKAGDASRLADLMLDREMIFPAFIELLAHSKWSVRLGAMVVIEEITERNPVLALQAAGPLWKKFESAGEQVKGDIIHVLGELSDSHLIPSLKGIATGDYGADIREAAEEALEKIAGRG
jgi:hypothetical protein